MSGQTVVIAALIGLAFFIGIILIFELATKRSVLARLEEASRPLSLRGLERYRANPREIARETLNRVGGARYDKSSRGSNLSVRLATAGVTLRPAEWIAICTLGSCVTGAVAFIGTHAVVSTVMVAALTLAVAQMWLASQERRRRRSFNNQLGPAIQAISNGIKAGYTFVQAMGLVGQKTPSPLGPELMRVARACQLGMPLHEAFGQMVVRNPSEDLRLMHTAVQIQQQIGGNLAGILDSIEFTIRDRVRIRGDIQTLTGQARASGWILIVLPIGLGGILAVLSPTYFSPMFSRTLGQVLLGAAGFSLVCGYGLIRKIVNVKI